jgi:hypothetical protein
MSESDIAIFPNVALQVEKENDYALKFQKLSDEDLMSFVKNN